MTMSRALDIATAAPASAAGVGRSKAGSDLFAHPVVPVLTGVAVALLVAVAVNFARSSGLVVGLWAASGVAVAVWLRTGSGRRHDMVFALVLTVSLMIGELISGNSPALSLLFTAGNLIEIGAAVFLVRRVLPSLHILSLGSTVRFLLCALIAILLVSYLVVCWAFMPLFLTKGRGFDPDTMSWLMATLGVSAGLGSFVVPAISDAIGRRPVMIFFAFLGVILPLGGLFYTGSAWVLAAIFFFGWGLNGLFPMFMAKIGRAHV